MCKIILSLFLLSAISFSMFAQKKQYYPIAFYNVENLFDTHHDKDKEDLDFTPDGKYRWTEDKYRKKLSNIASVISRLGKPINASGITILGLAEIENNNVLKDLLNQESLKDRNYKFVHKESVDTRGIDVALVYDSVRFGLRKTAIYPYSMPGRRVVKTRDILVVSGILANEPLTILINHWPSRRENNSSILRERAAGICKHIVDSIYRENRHTNVVIMGDLNDNPTDISTRVVLNAKRDKAQVKAGGVYNTMWHFYEEGKGSSMYRNEWNMFDQIIISQNLLAIKKDKLAFLKSEIYHPKYLIQDKGRYKGSPYRTFNGTNFINGYSDHLPTLIYLVK